MAETVLDEAASTLRETHEEYAGDADRPVGSYVGLMGAYGAVTLGLAAVVRRRGGLPDRVRGADLALLAVATHRLSRTLTKASVTAPLRAPFTRYEGRGGPGEVHEEVRGHGVSHAVGELLTCPFCMSQWLATSFTFGLVLAPKPTRFAMSVLAAVAGADVLQFGYCILENKAKG